MVDQVEKLSADIAAAGENLIRFPTEYVNSPDNFVEQVSGEVGRGDLDEAALAGDVCDQVSWYSHQS